MNRRNFLKTGSTAGIAITAAGWASCQSEPTKAATAGSIATSAYTDFELNEATIDDLQERMKNGELTSKGITELYLQRIDAIDKKGPALNAVIEINPDAINIAESMDKE